MQGVAPGVPPKELLRAIRESIGFKQISSDPALRRALWDRQNGRCAYCERVLRNPASVDHRTRIEHFHPQGGMVWAAECAKQCGVSSDADAPVAWSNLLLCCDGNERAGRDFTCDKLKHDTDICSDFINPQRWTGGPLLTIGRDGRATPRPGLPARADLVVNAVLNLNSVELVKARKSVLTARRALIERVKTRSHGLSPKQRADMAQRLRRDAETQEYGTVLISLADTLVRAK